MANLAASINRLTEFIGNAVSWIVLALGFTVCSEVFWRFSTGTSLFWAYDATYTLCAAFFLLGASYALKYGAHIRSDFIYNALPLATRLYIDIFGYLFLFMPLFALTFWYGLDATLSSHQSGQRSIVTRWAPPVWPLRAIIPAAALLLFLQCLSNLITSFRHLSSARNP